MKRFAAAVMALLLAGLGAAWAQEAPEVEISLYQPDENTAFSYVVQRVADDAQAIVDALIELGSAPEGTEVLRFSIVPGEVVDEGELDLSRDFLEALLSAGAAGETGYVGSLVNTFLEHYQLSAILLTVEGEAFETDYQIYDEALTFYVNPVCYIY